MMTWLVSMSICAAWSNPSLEATLHGFAFWPLYLLSVPGMRESIREGMDTPVDGCDKELDW